MPENTNIREKNNISDENYLCEQLYRFLSKAGGALVSRNTYCQAASGRKSRATHQPPFIETSSPMHYLSVKQFLLQQVQGCNQKLLQKGSVSICWSLMTTNSSANW